MTLAPEEHGELRLTLSRLFEEGAIAASGNGTYTNAEGTIVPARVRIVSMGDVPYFIVEHTADGTGQTLSSDRAFALDGAIALMQERGDIPVAWTAER